MLPKSITNQNDNVFSLYKPFRNFLRKTDLVGCLKGIHSHSNHILFGKDLFVNIIKAPSGYSVARNFSDFIEYGLMPWDLNILAKEVIIHSEMIGEKKTFEDWNVLADAANKLKFIQNKITKIYVSKANVLGEMHRLSHQQFVWQRRPQMVDIAKYWKLYSDPDLKKLLYKTTHLQVDDLYLLGFAFIGFFLGKFAIYYPPNIEIRHLNNRHVEKFLKRFCLCLEDLKKRLSFEQEMNDKFTYAYNSLHAYPLIKLQYENRDAIVCPIPALLFKRITEGLYYEICKQPEFAEVFGKSFQRFIGIMLNLGGDGLKVFKEEVYDKHKKRTVDWIVYDKNAALFVECKAKRMTIEAKAALLDDRELHKQLDIMADSVVQVYKGIIDYKDNKYPQIKYNLKTKVYPVIVTLEEWFLFGDTLIPLLNEKIKNKLSNLNIAESILESSPYAICSVNGLDLLIQTSKLVGIKKIMSKKNSNADFKVWQLDTFISTEYKAEMTNIKNLFMDEFENHLRLNKI